MTATATEIDLTTELDEWLATLIPCESLHAGDEFPCNTDRAADWHMTRPCGCSVYICDQVRAYRDMVARDLTHPSWRCPLCHHIWLKTQDSTTWRRIR